MATPGGDVRIIGNDITDAFKRKNIIKKIQDSTTTQELEMIEQMITPKGLQSLKKHWKTIKRFF